MAKLKSPVMLLIMDGFGNGDINDPTNAIATSNLPNFQMLKEIYPTSELSASGLDVGLPEGQMGNSEVGHLNIGAGRIVYQELTRISKDAQSGELFNRPVMQELFTKAKNGRLQLIGLLSDGGVHSHIEHLKAIIKGAKDFGIKEVYVHALLDGRDVPPSSARTYIEDLERFMLEIQLGKIASIGGRYYGMDRDKRWERIQKAYEVIVDGTGLQANSTIEALDLAYQRGETDEFVQPTIVDSDGCIKDNDAVLFFNFRPDRARQFTRALRVSDFLEFGRKPLDIFVATMTKYEDDLPVQVVYSKETLKNTLGEIFANEGLHQLRIAETEKYAHVTYFFNGGIENLFPNEDRILVPSPKVATYDLQPEMSAYEVTDKVLEAIQKGRYDLIVLNFANPDMVGHTGNFVAAQQAVKVVDECVGKIVKEFIARNGHILLTADHGNCDKMVDHETNIPHTAHTTNPVPLIIISEEYKHAQLKNGRLCDLAPTILALAGIEQPVEMTGESLLKI